VSREIWFLVFSCCLFYAFLTLVHLWHHAPALMVHGMALAGWHLGRCVFRYLNLAIYYVFLLLYLYSFLLSFVLFVFLVISPAYCISRCKRKRTLNCQPANCLSHEPSLPLIGRDTPHVCAFLPSPLFPLHRTN